MEEIKAVLRLPPSSESLAGRSAAYSSLVQLQKQEDWASNSALCAESASLLPLVLSDVSIPHEEIATQALKCLGFMVYHPSLVPTIPGSTARLIMESLANLATTTQIKAVCNLSVWCISIQQFETPIVDSCLHHLIRAIIYALDNPFGSLSTTYEAIQAVLKLSSQLRGRMETLGCIWMPPIYKRLLSSNKKEREMSERCLLQIENIIFPPSPSLSKAVAFDLKKTLLGRLMELLKDHCQKIVAIRAWKWYIHLLWSNVLKNRLLFNEMLKILERTFCDPDPSIQMATLVAWKSLIDALLANQNLDPDAKETNGCSFLGHLGVEPGSLQLDISRRLNLLGRPLVKLVSSSSETSACSSCFTTWSYLLHKIDVLVNHPFVKANVVGPFLESVFSKGPGSKNKWLWDSCVKLVHEFVMLELEDRGRADDTTNSCNQLSIKAMQAFEEKNFSIKWFPWKLHDVTHILKMIDSILSQGLIMHVTQENRILMFGAALRIFKSLLKGIQFRTNSNHENSCQSYIEAILDFAKKLCENVINILAHIHTDLLSVTLHFLEAIMEELKPSMLSVSHHKIVLDISYISKLTSEKDFKCMEMFSNESLAYMDMISPSVYLITLYFCTVSQFLLEREETDTILHAMLKSRFASVSFEAVENIQVLVSILYMHRTKYLPVWMRLIKLWEVVAENMKGYIEQFDDRIPVKQSGHAGYFLMQRFLCYPFSIGYLSDSTSPMDSSSWLSLKPEVKLKSLLEVWKTLMESLVIHLHSLGSEKDLECFCNLLGDLSVTVELNMNNMDSYLMKFQKEVSLSVFDAVLGCISIRNQLMQDSALSLGEDSQGSSICKKDKPIGTIMDLISRVVCLTFTLIKVYSEIKPDSVVRISSIITQVFSCLYLKQHIGEFIKTISDPLLRWFSSLEAQQERTASQVQPLWENILKCLEKSKTLVSFDVSFLRVLSPLLEVTLNHAHPPISSVTLSFWKSTYGGKPLPYPEGLHSVLMKLVGKGLLSLNYNYFVSANKATTSEADLLKQSLGTSASMQKHSIDDVELETDTGSKHRRQDVGTPCLSNKRRRSVDFLKGKEGALEKSTKNYLDAIGFDWDFHHLFENKKELVRAPGCILGMLKR